jgi:NADPH:quinone reductase-like Zn-dependent oxidoreductase
MSSERRLPEVLRGSIEIERPCAEVFAFVSDLSNYARWFPGIAYMRPVDDAPIDAGKRYDEVALLPYSDKQERIQVEIVAFDPGKHFAIHASLAPPLPRFDYTFAPLSAERTRFEWVCRTRGQGLIMPLARSVMRRVLRPRLNGALANLKRILAAKPEAMMTAAVIRHFGDASDTFDVTSTVARPVPAKGQILVQQMATSINPISVQRRKGYGRNIFKLRNAHGWPLILGEDICGRVADVSPGVKGYSRGDLVFGVKPPSVSGAYAEYAVVDPAHLRVLPAGASPHDSAALPYAFLTAWQALLACGLSPKQAHGKHVFVQGGAGGVGAMAVQIAREWGAEVAASGRARQFDVMRSLGATQVFERAVGGYDQLKDLDAAVCTASMSEQAHLLSILKRDGRATLATVIHPTLALTDQFGVVRGLMKARSVRAKAQSDAKRQGRRIEWVLFKADAKALDAMANMLSEGRLRPVLGRRFALNDIAAAHDAFDKGTAGGKIIVTFGSEVAS